MRELGDQILHTLQDPSYTDSIYTFINQSIRHVAGVILCPALETSNVLLCTADTNTVALPADYHRELYAAKTDEPIEVYSSLSELLIAQPSAILLNNENISAITLVNNQVWCNAKPTTETAITIYYYRLPTVLTAEDTIEEITDFDLIKYKTLAALFAEIEDGPAGSKDSTMFYENKYNARLDEWDRINVSGQSQKAPRRVSSWV